MLYKETLRGTGPAGWRDFCRIAGAESLGPSPQPWTRLGGLVAAPGGQRSSPERVGTAELGKVCLGGPIS